MKIEVTLRKLMDKAFRPTLQRVMEKWPEASDIHALVKIAEAIDSESKGYFAAVQIMTDQHGFQLKGRKSVSVEEITDDLLQDYGKFRPDGQMTIAGASEEDFKEFLKKKVEADQALRTFNAEHIKFIDTSITIEIPRLIKITDKLIRKEVISANDCYVLGPILDLSAVSDI